MGQLPTQQVARVSECVLIRPYADNRFITHPGNIIKLLNQTNNKSQSEFRVLIN